jgi:hypothetical protein
MRLVRNGQRRSEGAHGTPSGILEWLFKRGVILWFLLYSRGSRVTWSCRFKKRLSIVKFPRVASISSGRWDGADIINPEPAGTFASPHEGWKKLTTAPGTEDAVELRAKAHDGILVYDRISKAYLFFSFRVFCYLYPKVERSVNISVAKYGGTSRQEHGSEATKRG